MYVLGIQQLFLNLNCQRGLFFVQFWQMLNNYFSVAKLKLKHYFRVDVLKQWIQILIPFLGVLLILLRIMAPSFRHREILSLVCGLKWISYLHLILHAGEWGSSWIWIKISRKYIFDRKERMKVGWNTLWKDCLTSRKRVKKIMFIIANIN